MLNVAAKICMIFGTNKAYSTTTKINIKTDNLVKILI